MSNKHNKDDATSSRKRYSSYQEPESDESLTIRQTSPRKPIHSLRKQ